jgi:hypothetical protein
MSFKILVAVAAAIAVSGAAMGRSSNDASVPAKTNRVCKTNVETGSLVKKRKICKTLAEWDAQIRVAGDKLDEMRRPINSCGATTPGGC